VGKVRACWSSKGVHSMKGSVLEGGLLLLAVLLDLHPLLLQACYVCLQVFQLLPRICAGGVSKIGAAA
jgi:hypothetical protein